MYVIQDKKECRFIEKGLCNKSALVIYCDCVAEKNIIGYKLWFLQKNLNRVNISTFFSFMINSVFPFVLYFSQEYSQRLNVLKRAYHSIGVISQSPNFETTVASQTS